MHTYLPTLVASNADEAMGMVAVIAVFSIPVIAIVAGSITKITKTHARERSRREIAAYIAEGSLTPEEGERLMSAGRKNDV